MSLTINHQTNDISASSGSMTIDGSSVGGGGGKVLQVKSVTKTDVFSFTGTTSGTDITGMSLSITPAATSSKILIIVQCTIVGTDAGMGINLLRGSTQIALGDASGSNKRRTSIIGMYRGSSGAVNAFSNGANHLNFLDSPSTTSATTYKLQATGTIGTFYVNRTDYDTDNTYAQRCVSTLTLMEVGA